MAGGTDPRAQERVGSVLNEKWTLESLLGIGGMGAVYAGRHRNGARAAVKVLHPELARIPEVRERFLREGYAANRVEHRGAVQVLDDDVIKEGDDEGTAYLVMELLEGESLEARADRSPKLGERDLLEIFDVVLDVLAKAHDNGVVHRDLKPENIFLAKDPDRDAVRVKVLDFGLARLVDTSSVTNNGIALGTPSFMSPEQAAGKSEEIDGKTDIFALGATGFRILTGRRIHEADNMVALVVMMATSPAPRLRSVEPNVSEAFARVIDRALAFEKKDRYADARAMQADVRAALDLFAAGEERTIHVLPFSARGASMPSEFETRPTRRPDSAPLFSMATARRSDRPTAEVAAIDPPSEAPETKRRASRVGSAEAWDGSSGEEDSKPGRAERSKSSSTLPWLLAIACIGGLAWHFGPELQAELARRASLPPVKELWAGTAASSDGGAPSASSAPSPATSTSTTAAAAPPPSSSHSVVDEVTETGATIANAIVSAIADAGILADAGDDDDDDDDDDPDGGSPGDAGAAVANRNDGPRPSPRAHATGTAPPKRPQKPAGSPGAGKKPRDKWHRHKR